MNDLDQLAIAWRDAQQKQIIAPEFVDHHIANMADAMNKGIKIIPSVTFDCHGTLMCMDDTLGDNGYNVGLYSAGKEISAHPSVDRLFTLASSKPTAPEVAIETLDPLNKSVITIGKDEHNRNLSPSWWKSSKVIYEVLFDDKGLMTEYPQSFATIFVPTWDKGLITFPKLT
jgi:hypothetical protein